MNRHLRVECNGTFPWSGNILAIGTSEAARNVRALAQDIVCRRPIAKQAPVQICAAMIIGFIFTHPTSSMFFVLRSIERNADSIIQSFLSDAPRLIADVSRTSADCAEMLRSGLETYSCLTEEQRSRLIDDLKRDVGEHYLAHDVEGKTATKPFPIAGRRALAVLALMLSTLCAVYIPHGWLPALALLLLGCITWFASFGTTIYLAKPAEEIRDTLHVRAACKLRALNSAQKLLNEVHYSVLRLPSWMSQPELRIDHCNMEYVRIVGSVIGDDDAAPKYEFTIAMHLYEDDFELHRQRFQADLHQRLLEAREELASELRLID